MKSVVVSDGNMYNVYSSKIFSRQVHMSTLSVQRNLYHLTNKDDKTPTYFWVKLTSKNVWRIGDTICQHRALNVTPMAVNCLQMRQKR